MKCYALLEKVIDVFMYSLKGIIILMHLGDRFMRDIN